MRLLAVAMAGAFLGISLPARDLLTAWKKETVRIRRDAEKGVQIVDVSDRLLGHVNDEIVDMKEQHALAEKLALSDDERSSTLQAVRTSREGLGGVSKLEKWKTVGFGSALSFLNILGQQKHEYGLVAAAINVEDPKGRLKNDELARYLRFAYVPRAIQAFDRGEYAFGMQIVRDGYQRAKLLNIAPLHGTDSGDIVTSSFLIILTFFPNVPAEVGDIEYWLNAGVSILQDEYDGSLDHKAAPKSLQSLGQYMAGVNSFRQKNFEEARRRFEIVYKTAETPQQKSLAGLMRVRTEFYDAYWRIAELLPKKTAKAVPQSAPKPANTITVESFMRAFARVLIEEGVLIRRGPTEVQTKDAEVRKKESSYKKRHQIAADASEKISALIELLPQDKKTYATVYRDEIEELGNAR